MKDVIRVTDAPVASGPLSQGVIAGPFVFVSGQTPKNPATGDIPDGIREQTKQVLRNVEAVLRGAECTMADVVKVTAHLTDLANFAAFNEVYREHFQEPFPARTTVGSQLNQILVEVDVTAYRSDGKRG